MTQHTDPPGLPCAIVIAAAVFAIVGVSAQIFSLVNRRRHPRPRSK